MQFYTNVHEAYCGIDLHARSMYVCIVNRDGEIMLHRNMPTTPEIFLKAIAPYRQDLVVAVECMFTWYWFVARVPPVLRAPRRKTPLGNSPSGPKPTTRPSRPRAYGRRRPSSKPNTLCGQGSRVASRKASGALTSARVDILG
jgi:hypothetical protein